MSRAPISPAIKWGRRLALLGAFILQMSPFLIWARVPFLGLTLWIPGLFLHGILVFAIGLLVTLLILFRIRQPFWMGTLALLAAGAVLWSRHEILAHTDELLGRVQTSFETMNSALTTLHLTPVTVSPSGWTPDRYLGSGLAITLIGAAVILVGALVELRGYGYSKEVLSVLIGLPRCRFCHVRVAWSMDYCPGCGQRQMPGRPCPACGQWLQDDFKFCTACGVESPRDAASVRDLVVPLKRG
jgi:hypothetical protein